MSDVIAAAITSVLASVVGSGLTIVVRTHEMRCWASSSNGTLLGPTLDDRLEGVDLRLACIEDSLPELRKRLAFGDTRALPPRCRN